MKTFTLPIVCFLLMFSLSGCGLMEDAFKTGLFFGLILVAVIALLIWVLRFGMKLLIKNDILDLSE
ncbi:MAG TPA: hypothetical protein VNW95_16295 [Mucilaginibacter sp.]|jgi:hypothetical protein|nr:hypothetical protein [Mucilaginibacter sp.]